MQIIKGISANYIKATHWSRDSEDSEDSKFKAIILMKLSIWAKVSLKKHWEKGHEGKATTMYNLCSKFNPQLICTLRFI